MSWPPPAKGKIAWHSRTVLTELFCLISVLFAAWNIWLAWTEGQHYCVSSVHGMSNSRTCGTRSSITVSQHPAKCPFPEPVAGSPCNSWTSRYRLRKGAFGGKLWNSNGASGSTASGIAQFWSKSVVHGDTKASHMDLGLSISSQNPRIPCPQRLQAIKVSCRSYSGTLTVAEAVFRLMDTIPPSSIW